MGHCWQIRWWWASSSLLNLWEPACFRVRHSPKWAFYSFENSGEGSWPLFWLLVWWHVFLIGSRFSTVDLKKWPLVVETSCCFPTWTSFPLYAHGFILPGVVCCCWRWWMGNSPWWPVLALTLWLHLFWCNKQLYNHCAARSAHSIEESELWGSHRFTSQWRPQCSSLVNSAFPGFPHYYLLSLLYLKTNPVSLRPSCLSIFTSRCHWLPFHEELERSHEMSAGTFMIHFLNPRGVSLPLLCAFLYVVPWLWGPAGSCQRITKEVLGIVQDCPCPEKFSRVVILLPLLCQGTHVPPGFWVNLGRFCILLAVCWSVHLPCFPKSIGTAYSLLTHTTTYLTFHCGMRLTLRGTMGFPGFGHCIGSYRDIYWCFASTIISSSTIDDGERFGSSPDPYRSSHVHHGWWQPLCTFFLILQAASITHNVDFRVWFARLAWWQPSRWNDSRFSVVCGTRQSVALCLFRGGGGSSWRTQIQDAFVLGTVVSSCLQRGLGALLPASFTHALMSILMYFSDI